MIKILLVCHGNICRSPMAEFILRDMVEKMGFDDVSAIQSAATSREEIGNSLYPPARRLLESKGIKCDGHRARQVTKADYENFDYILCMEKYNLKNIQRIIPEDPENKIHLLLDFTDSPRDIADPWYTGDFELTYDDIVEGCTGLLDALKLG